MTFPPDRDEALAWLGGFTAGYDATRLAHPKGTYYLVEVTQQYLDGHAQNQKRITAEAIQYSMPDAFVEFFRDMDRELLEYCGYLRADRIWTSTPMRLATEGISQ